jgi:hypothetical protein
MHLEFYQLPTDSSAGMGEIRRAAFSGQAVVKQSEGTMKGDELAIDFSKSQPGRGQAVDRLVGHGNVFIKNQPSAAAPAVAPTAIPAAAPAAVPAAAPEPATSPPKMAIGDIACQDLDMVFDRDAAGETQPHELKAKGAVEINDPSGKIRAEDLVVKFGPAPKGGVEPQFFEAFGMPRAITCGATRRAERSSSKASPLGPGRAPRASSVRASNSTRTWARPLSAARANWKCSPQRTFAAASASRLSRCS